LDFSAGITFLFSQLGKLLFSPGSHFSLTSLACALLIATAFFVWQRVSRRRRVRARTILRALFPKRILHSRSNEADIGYLFFNVFVFGVMFGWRCCPISSSRTASSRDWLPSSAWFRHRLCRFT
jgi:hypothetical protein